MTPPSSPDAYAAAAAHGEKADLLVAVLGAGVIILLVALAWWFYVTPLQTDPPPTPQRPQAQAAPKEPSVWARELDAMSWDELRAAGRPIAAEDRR